MFIQVKGPPIYTVYRRFPLHWSIHMLPYHFPGSPHGSHVFSRGLHTLPLCRFLPLMLVLRVSTCYHSVGSFLPWQWFFLIRKVSFPRSLFFPSVLLLTILNLSPFSLGPPEVIQDI